LSFALVIDDPALKTLQRVDRPTERRLKGRIDLIAEDPFDRRVSKKLHGMEGLRSSRVGGGRILFSVDDEQEIIFISAIRPRGRAYR
jgi:mRNA interferase RelE/StbE